MAFQGHHSIFDIEVYVLVVPVMGSDGSLQLVLHALHCPRGAYSPDG